LYDYRSHSIKRYEFIAINIAKCAYAPRHLASANACNDQHFSCNVRLSYMVGLSRLRTLVQTKIDCHERSVLFCLVRVALN